VAPEQPWLDGFCVEKNVIRQFVAARLGEGITAEEQLTGQAEWGGVQLLVAPMARPAFERHFPMERANRPQMMEAMVSYCQAEAVGDMGLGLGGRMHQEIAKDPYDLADWDQEAASRCFVHLVRAEDWKTLTGKEAPRLPMDVADYLGNKGPWYLHPGTGKPVGGSKKLAGLKTVESFF